MDWQEQLAQQLHDLPAQPGVYMMQDENGTVIYVGKATSLRQRVRSYFQQGAKENPKTASLVERVHFLEVVVVPSPVEALILESNLIKKYHPRYNVRLMDDKHYPYLKVSLEEDFPRLSVVRAVREDGNRYFGPYTSSAAMHTTERLIREIFPLRTCGNNEFYSRKRPCLNHQIKRCAAPCAGEISREDYRFMVEQVVLFLEGRTNDIVKKLRREMEEASLALRFEDAARLRDQLQAVELVQKQQQIDQGSQEDRDIWGVAQAEDKSVAQVFFIREGKLSGREHFTLINTAAMPEQAVLEGFLPQYYSSSDFIPPEICLPNKVEDQAVLEEALSRYRGKKVSLLVPKRGDKKKLVDLATANARLIWEQTLKREKRQEGEAAAALEELRLVLRLPHSPHRIECMDISHIQGAYTVASQVTFLAGKPKKDLYRRYRIQTVEGVDDFASMREVVIRRLRRGLEERQALREGGLAAADAKMADFPDLLLIDGGKGQLSAVCDIMQAMGLGHIPVFGLAKRYEEIFAPGESDPIVLPLDSAALQLLQRVRDEAHRFAITYHRSLRQKGQVLSALDGVDGIGPQRRRALWKAFGSLEAMKKADLETLACVEGMNRRAAQALYEYLHPMPSEAGAHKASDKSQEKTQEAGREKPGDKPQKSKTEKTNQKDKANREGEMKP